MRAPGRRPGRDSPSLKARALLPGPDTEASTTAHEPGCVLSPSPSPAPTPMSPRPEGLALPTEAGALGCWEGAHGKVHS